MTAENITIPPLLLPARPTLKQVLNPRVGNKLLETDNHFQQELLIGSRLVHQPDEDHLLISPEFFYKKNVRKEVPPVILQPGCGAGADQSAVVTWRRGMRRWTALPDIIEVCFSIEQCPR